MAGKVNYDVIVLDDLGVGVLEDVETRTTREIVGLEELAHVGTEIAAAAGY